MILCAQPSREGVAHHVDVLRCDVSRLRRVCAQRLAGFHARAGGGVLPNQVHALDPIGHRVARDHLAATVEDQRVDLVEALVGRRGAVKS